jgi:tetratricopeptide (TPR) repeat protein
MNLDNCYIGADSLYKMDRLFEDSREVKGKALSAEERLFLRAAALCTPIAQVALLLGWKLSTAQVFVSNTIKIYLKHMLSSTRVEQTTPDQAAKLKLSWHSLPNVFKQLGYARPPKQDDEQNLLRKISSDPTNLNVKRLIVEVKRTIYQIEFEGYRPILPKILTEDPDTLIDKILASVIDNKNPDLKRAAYLEAIAISWLLVTQDPIQYVDHIVKIARNLSTIGRYEDSVPLALAFVDRVSDQADRAKLYYVLGLAYEKMAEAVLSNHYRQQAILFYQQSIDWGDSKNCLAFYNVFSLNFEFAQKLKNEPEHLLEARTALRQFEQTARSPGFNFYRYKSLIHTDMRRIQAQTQDPILLGDLGLILDW